jgi:phosphoribosylanthranilate isomerase
MASSLHIKICGITRPLDARHAAELGADAVGLNFYPPSPRHVDPAMVSAILRELPLFVEPVGVFVQEPLGKVCQMAREFGLLRSVQWHGDRHEVADTFPFRLICAFQVREPSDLAVITRHVEVCREHGHPPAAILVDAHLAGQFGGTGKTAPWHLLADFQPGVPLMLAGGLTPDNVAEAVRLVRPFGVDVASGVESGPGIKDLEKMRRFIGNAREAAAR